MMSFNNWYFNILASERDPFKILDGGGVSRNPQLRDNAASAYNLFLVIGIIGLVVTLIISGLRFAWTKNSSKRSGIKENLGSKAIAAIIFFSFITIISLVYGVIKKLT